MNEPEPKEKSKKSTKVQLVNKKKQMGMKE
jgi:hypothetical protein